MFYSLIISYVQNLHFSLLFEAKLNWFSGCHLKPCHGSSTFILIFVMQVILKDEPDIDPNDQSSILEHLDKVVCGFSLSDDFCVALSFWLFSNFSWERPTLVSFDQSLPLWFLIVVILIVICSYSVVTKFGYSA